MRSDLNMVINGKMALLIAAFTGYIPVNELERCSQRQLVTSTKENYYINTKIFHRQTLFQVARDSFYHK